MIAAGTIQCQFGTSPVTKSGFYYSSNELVTALSGSVAGYKWVVWL